MGSLHSFLCKSPTICKKCFDDFRPVFNKFYIENIECLNIFEYDDQIKEKLYQFKGCFDYELSTVFLEYFRPYLRHKFFGYILVPAPSSVEADEKRGFNHVVEMFKTLKMPIEKCIKKTKDMKQSDLSVNERKNIGNFLEILDVDFSQKKILIVDDVFTTGSTVKAMINLIKTKHPKKIKVLVMSKTKQQENV